MIFNRIKRILVGAPLTNQMITQERLPKWKALSVLSSDALSSVTYATEEVLVPLAVFGLAAMSWSVPVAAGVTLLLVILVASYRQTIEAYPGGSGAYFVVKENLGTKAGLVAGAALLIDYVLTVAVSVSAGVENLASAVPYLHDHIPGVSAGVIFVLMILHLRGVKASGNIFALPTYFFIFSFVFMIGTGFWKLLSGEALPVAPAIPQSYEAIPLLVILRAFSAGCVALTGVEAISDGVPVFRPPAQKNAKSTLLLMGTILALFFLSITSLVNAYGILPTVGGETVISQLARGIFGQTGHYYMVQASVALILFLAANTAYSDFPRVSSFLARDRFLPRQLASRGDRLVFSNGILGLSITASALIFIFGDAHHLIPLYAVGVFLTFTLSQAGMVKHHLKKRENRWIRSILFNATGMITTFVVLMVLTYTKFMDGAWMVVAVIPVMLLFFLRINKHYMSVGKELSLIGKTAPGKLEPIKHTVIVPISGIHRGVVEALRYAMSISNDVRACYVEIDPATTERMKDDWQKWAHEIPFVVLKSPYRSVIGPLLEYIDDVEQTTHGDVITVIVPEFVTSKWWHQILHNQTAFLIRAALLFRPGKVVTSVRYHLKET